MYWKYLKYVIRHKWFVFNAGLTYKVPLSQLLIHDWSKFLPSEFIPYARYFYGNYPALPKLEIETVNGKQVIKNIDERGEIRFQLYKEDIKNDFDKAWLFHQRRNPHHHQYWLLAKDDGTSKALDMPEKYVREMVADWVGAGKAQGKDDVKSWYDDNKAKMILNPNTRTLVEELLNASY